MIHPPGIASLLVEHGGVRFGDFILASGQKSNVYIDVKQALRWPGFLTTIAYEILGRVGEFDTVAGVAIGGIPLAVAVSLLTDRSPLREPKPFAIIRKEEKTHGLKGKVIGDVEGFEVLLVEDVTTTGTSALYGVEALREAGATVNTRMTVVRREAEAQQKLLAADVNLRWLTTLEDILATKETIP